MEENQYIIVDGELYPFNKSMRLKKGNHTVELYLNETNNSCENMFKNCENIKTIFFNISYNCLNSMENMFNGCSLLSSVDFAKIITSEVKTMKNLFYNCSSLQQLNIKNIDTNNVINMEGMFSDCNTIEEINLANLKTNSLINMNYMFNGCTNLKKLDITSFNTFLVENMYHLFYGYTSLQSVDISNFILYKLKDDIKNLFDETELGKNSVLKEMFNSLEQMKEEQNIIKDIDSNVVMEITIFPQESSLINIFGPKFKIEQISKSKMLIDNQQEKEISNQVELEINQEHYIKILLEGNLTNASGMFEGCKERLIHFSKNFNDSQRRVLDKSNIIDMNSMFKSTSNLTIDLSFFNTQKVEKMSYMFYRNYDITMIINL